MVGIYQGVASQVVYIQGYSLPGGVYAGISSLSMVVGVHPWVYPTLYHPGYTVLTPSTVPSMLHGTRPEPVMPR